MINLSCVILLCMLAEFVKADYCQENFTVGDLPGGIREEAIGLILTGTLVNFVGCPGNTAVLDEDVKFLFYSRNNSEDPIFLDPKNPVQVNTNKPTILLVHGWTCTINGSRMPELRKAYLQRYDCNVIGIDWSARSIDLWSSAFCSVPGVAKIVAAFLCNLNAALHQVHIVGHSMGGQIAGLTGQEVQKRCNKILGRITGLDPAGVLFQELPPWERLDASDAAFVDVIHTNQALLGFYGSCGDADFFPNCGTFQPGCIKIDDTTSVQKIINLPISIAACSHFRSCDYMIESINGGNKTFVATSCKGCPGLPITGPCFKDFLNPKYTVMGENCPSDPPASKFYLTTNWKSPFAQG